MENKKIALIIILLIMVFLEGFAICLGVDLINDKNAYIRGLQSDKAVCNGKLDSIIGDYAKMENELREYKRIYGDLK